MTGLKIQSKFGAQTFFALRHSGDICGSNGLPLTPNSIAILGRAQLLKSIKHRFLSSQLDFIRGKHERIVLVSEYYNSSIHNNFELQFEDIMTISYQVLTALNHLNEYGIVHRMLSPENILLDDKGDVKLFNFGVYYITGGGKDVAFPIGVPNYTAPEVFLLNGTEQDYYSSPKVDVWSLGVILLELIMKKILWHGLKLSQCLRKVLSLIHCDDVLSRLARELDSFTLYEEMNPELKDFLRLCLNNNPHERPMPKELLNHSIFKNISISRIWGGNSADNSSHPLDDWKLSELYHLWQLAGGDVQTELKKNGLIRNKSPILSLPRLVLLESMSFGHVKDESSMLDLKVVSLSLDALVQRLGHIHNNAYYPLLETKSFIIENRDNTNDSERLPLIIRERDTEYQFHRIVLFKRLLQGYPYKKMHLHSEACSDIPPYYRSKIWAALLNIEGDVEERYTNIDKETPIPTDRQIEVDIPRCHQYNELLSSKSGHLKLKRILKAWVVSYPNYVYWQGLDSLCASFLYLNFNHEAKAYACLSAFIPKYLNNFFLKDNSAVIKEYLAKFSHLIVFHDPVLANHLHEINFVPELFAIPWFLTMFSHVFPLHKIFHLWDKLLLGDSSYPLFVGFAILQQLRDTLLSSGFNECILLFSDLPEVDIEGCVLSSSDLYMTTPKSITFRKCQLHPDDISHLDISDVDILEIQKEYCPRISSSDLISFVNSKHTRSEILIVDIRHNYEFVEEAIPGSINIPFDGVDFERENCCNGIPPGPELSILINNKEKVIIVIGSKNSEAAKFCEYVAKGEFPKVCNLHGGISVLKKSGILAPVIT